MTLDAPTERIERFHRVLVQRIRDVRPEYLESPFTVAEIYQDLVPYATHRDRLGVEMNGDYEDILLRLLAGEGDYLVLESSHARDRLRDELRAPNPDTGVYREFAAVDVRLRPEAVMEMAEGPQAGRDAVMGTNGNGPAAPTAQEESSGDPAAGESVDVVEVGDLAPSAPQVPSASMAEGGAAGVDAEPEQAGTAPRSGDMTQCAWCREELPVRDNLNYCPFCGIDVHVVPCRSCGEALEPIWRFCIACGAEAAD